ncbi:MAG: phosphonate ABC transporter substrate-binding protein [Pseudomonadota bacterium]
MKRMLLAGVAAIALTGAATAQEIEELNFGIISTESSAALEESFGPFLVELEEFLGIPVNPFFAQDYAGVIEGMRFDEVDVAWFGNASAMQAVDRAEGEIFAQTVKDTGEMGYYSLLIANVDNDDINGIEDVLNCDAGFTFGNGDPNSTSGFLVPSYYVFALNGVTPDDCYSRVLNSNHETNALAVANGQVDFATNNTESLYARLVQERPEDAANIKEIWRSPLIPGDPMVWRGDLPQSAKNQIYTFFMTFGRMGTPEEVAAERAILANLSDGWGPFVPSSNAQLYPIRQLALFRDRLTTEADDTLSDDEKAERIAEIDAQLDELNRLAETVPNM